MSYLARHNDQSATAAVESTGLLAVLAPGTTLLHGLGMVRPLALPGPRCCYAIPAFAPVSATARGKCDYRPNSALARWTASSALPSGYELSDCQEDFMKMKDQVAVRKDFVCGMPDTDLSNVEHAVPENIAKIGLVSNDVHDREYLRLRTTNAPVALPVSPRGLTAS